MGAGSLDLLPRRHGHGQHRHVDHERGPAGRARADRLRHDARVEPDRHRHVVRDWCEGSRAWRTSTRPSAARRSRRRPSPARPSSTACARTSPAAPGRPQVAITYPATTSTTSPAPAPTPTPVTASFQMGLVPARRRSTSCRSLQQLGAHTARMEFDIGTPAANMASIDGRLRAVRASGPCCSRPSTAVCRRAPRRRASPAGRPPTARAARSGRARATPPRTGVKDIEFGNETSYSYQFSDNSLSTYAARAQSYAQLAKEAADRDQGREPERRPARDRRQRRQPETHGS